MPNGVATLIGIAILLVVLGFVVLRPRRLPEATAAVPAALLVLALGLVTPERAWATITELGPTLGFLAAILVVSHLADADGVFRWLGAQLSHHTAGSSQRLLVLVFGVAAATTAVLSLDATVVLLTPVVFVTVRRLTAQPAPHLYATAHLANSASLLLPISNLTNLLAFRASGLSFLAFTALMTLPWLAAIAVEYLVHRRFFAAELRAPVSVDTDPIPPPPITSLMIIATMLLGFAAAPAFGAEPWIVATAGAGVMAARSVFSGRQSAVRVVLAAHPLFIVFVAALAVVVDGATDQGLRQGLADLLPRGDSWGALMVLALIAAVLANLVNNLPATLVLLSALEAAGAGATLPAAAVLAVLIGVNIGPNLTYTGSLATLLWRRILLRDSHPASLVTFTRLGLMTVLPAILAATTALWVVTRG